MEDEQNVTKITSMSAKTDALDNTYDTPAGQNHQQTSDGDGQDGKP